MCLEPEAGLHIICMPFFVSLSKDRIASFKILTYKSAFPQTFANQSMNRIQHKQMTGMTHQCH